jgi:hypothetical protein
MKVRPLFYTLATFCLCLNTRVRALFNADPVDFASFPFFATLVFQNAKASSFWLCGSSLVNSTLLITAGHCVAGAAGVHVYLNTSVWLNPYEPSASIFSSTFLIDPQFHGMVNFYAHDFAFVVLPDPVDAITPLNVSTEQWDSFDSCSLFDVVGRGESCANGCLTPDLHHAQLPRLPESTCVSWSLVDDSTWLPFQVGNDLCLGYELTCATSPPTTTSTCPGDSGSPLFLNNSLLFGIVSRGDAAPCGQDSRPSIFASVFDANNGNFIQDALAGNVQAFQASGGACSAGLGLYVAAVAGVLMLVSFQ